MENSSKPLLSIVVPVFNEVAVLGEFYVRTKHVLDSLNLDCEMVFIDDGSSDGTWDIDKDISILRADKLFLNVAIMPELGVNAREYTEKEIVSLLNGVGISYVVTMPEFWIHLPVMKNLWSALNSEQFEEVAEIPSLRISRRETREGSLLIYRNQGPLEVPRAHTTSSLKRSIDS